MIALETCFLAKLDRRTFLKVMEEFPDILDDTAEIAHLREKIR